MASLAEQLQDLYQRFGELEGISIELQKDLIAIGVRNHAASAEVFLQGAQVSAYKRNGERPLLFLSKENQFQQGKPLRGGIPLCWPWFGDLDKNPAVVKAQYADDFIQAATAHGFIRQQSWQVDAIDITSPTETRLQLSLAIQAGKQWPFSARLRYDICVSETLEVGLKIENVGEQAFVMTSALHSYFSVADIEQARVQGLDGFSYIDALDNWQTHQQQGDVSITAEIDRIYHLAKKDQPLVLKDGKRAIALASKGSQSAVVWNPWIDKGQRLSQFSNGDYRCMLCIETANAMDDFVELSPGEEHCLALTIK